LKSNHRLRLAACVWYNFIVKSYLANISLCFAFNISLCLLGECITCTLDVGARLIMCYLLIYLELLHNLCGIVSVLFRLLIKEHFLPDVCFCLSFIVLRWLLFSRRYCCHCRSLFDASIDLYNVYKVETIGDAYLVASGLPTVYDRHAQEMSFLALELMQSVKHHVVEHLPEKKIQLRIGLHSGESVPHLSPPQLLCIVHWRSHYHIEWFLFSANRRPTLSLCDSRVG